MERGRRDDCCRVHRLRAVACCLGLFVCRSAQYPPQHPLAQGSGDVRGDVRLRASLIVWIKRSSWANEFRRTLLGGPHKDSGERQKGRGKSGRSRQLKTSVPVLGIGRQSLVPGNLHRRRSFTNVGRLRQNPHRDVFGSNPGVFGGTHEDTCRDCSINIVVIMFRVQLRASLKGSANLAGLFVSRDRICSFHQDDDIQS
jgi:hypothetical protein